MHDSQDTRIGQRIAVGSTKNQVARMKAKPKIKEHSTQKQWPAL